MSGKEHKTDITGEKLTWQKGSSSPFPWGPHQAPLVLQFGTVMITLEKQGSSFLYLRDIAGQKVEKQILSKTGKIYLHPVEPVQLPVKVGSHLLIAFKQLVIVEPQSNRTVFATFPLEIAVSVGRSRAGENIIDTFSVSRLKYSLYGSVRDGLICKYWLSDLHNSLPEATPPAEGVIKLAIQNSTAGWKEVNQVVFNAWGMKLYYGDNQVTLNAGVRIISESTAETSFIDSPLYQGAIIAPEQFTPRLLNQQGKTLMKEGY